MPFFSQNVNFRLNTLLNEAPQYKFDLVRISRGLRKDEAGVVCYKLQGTECELVTPLY